MLNNSDSTHLLPRADSENTNSTFSISTAVASIESYSCVVANSFRIPQISLSTTPSNRNASSLPNPGKRSSCSGPLPWSRPRAIFTNSTTFLTSGNDDDDDDVWSYSDRSFRYRSLQVCFYVASVIILLGITSITMVIVISKFRS